MIGIPIAAGDLEPGDVVDFAPAHLRETWAWEVTSTATTDDNKRVGLVRLAFRSITPVPGDTHCLYAPEATVFIKARGFA